MYTKSTRPGTLPLIHHHFYCELQKLALFDSPSLVYFLKPTKNSICEKVRKFRYGNYLLFNQFTFLLSCSFAILFSAYIHLLLRVLGNKWRKTKTRISKLLFECEKVLVRKSLLCRKLNNIGKPGKS